MSNVKFIFQLKSKILIRTNPIELSFLNCKKSTFLWIMQRSLLKLSKITPDVNYFLFFKRIMASLVINLASPSNFSFIVSCIPYHIMKTRLLIFLFLMLNQLPLIAQSQPLADSTFPLADYWPVLLLPIFGIVWYRWWKSRKRR